MPNSLTARRLLFTLIHALDGNFKAYIKAKRFDANDTPITDGAGFFPPWKDWARYCEQFQTLSSVSFQLRCIASTDSLKDGGTCPSYNKMHTITAHRGRFVSGLSSLVCARHGIFIPQGTVDLEKGETWVVRRSASALAYIPLVRFYRLDHCWAIGQGRQPHERLRRVLSCDRACSLSVNFLTRLRTEFPDDSRLHSIAEQIVWVIPKLHIHGHTESCQYRFHLAFTEGVGRTDGESVERSWVDTKEIAVISKDASPATRIDIINSEHDWSNFVRGVTMGEHVPFSVC